MLKGKHLIDPRDFSLEEMDSIFELTVPPPRIQQILFLENVGFIDKTSLRIIVLIDAN